VKYLFSRLSNAAALFNIPPLVWLFFHGGLAVALGLSFFSGNPPKINANLFDILPSSHNLKAAEPAEKALGDRNGRQVSLLIGNPNFFQAKQRAEEINRAFMDASVFETLFFKIDQIGISQFIEYLHTYRYSLLDPQTYTLLQQGAAEEIAQDALAWAFAGFTLAPLDTIALDPFLLTEREIRYFLSFLLAGGGGGLFLRDHVLTAEYEGAWYVLLQGTIAAKGVSLTNKDSAVEKIYALCEALTQEDPDTHIIYSGIPFHSYESSSNAQREISRISLITALIILALFCRVFRSPLPALASVAAAGFSILFAAGAALLWFREIHLLTFVFGTTLSGICVDYSIHYFMCLRGQTNADSGAASARFPRGITMSFVSTTVCFAALFFTPFSILRQFALFSIAGLSSSFLSIVCIYPLFKLGCRRVSRRAPLGFLSKKGKIIALSCVLAASGTALFLNFGDLRIENRLSNLYTMSERLRESERTAAQVLNRRAGGGYFIVSGATPEETLRREERLREQLDLDKEGVSYTAISLFIPSRETQRRRYEAAKGLLPLEGAQFEALGFPASASRRFIEDFSEARNRQISPDTPLPAYLERLAGRLWFGKPGGPYYSCVLPLRIEDIESIEDEERLRRIAGELEGVFFTHKAKDIGAMLDDLTRAMLLMFAAAYLLLCLVIRFFYPLRDTLRICAVPLITACITLAALSVLRIPLGFFSAAGLILVFGLGLDYMFYLVEAGGSPEFPEKRAATHIAVALSFTTTALSFGALGLSAFIPVRVFGLTVLTGLTGAFIATMLIPALRPHRGF
jgi:predicted exporter